MFKKFQNLFYKYIIDYIAMFLKKYVTFGHLKKNITFSLKCE